MGGPGLYPAALGNAGGECAGAGGLCAVGVGPGQGVYAAPDEGTILFMPVMQPDVSNAEMND